MGSELVGLIIFLTWLAGAVILALPFFRGIRNIMRQEAGELDSMDIGFAAMFTLLALLIWPLAGAGYLAGRAIIHFGNSDDRKARALAEARKIIAEYEAEQLRRKEKKQ
jgi:hypothetical protein